MYIKKVLQPEFVELVKAYDEGRIVVLPTRAEEQRTVVEKALEIRLFDWQVAYIWGNSSYLMPGRATGKTLAQILKLCLSEGRPFILVPPQCMKTEELDVDELWANPHWTLSEVRRIYTQLQLFQVPGLRKIYFSREEAQADGFTWWR